MRSKPQTIQIFLPDGSPRSIKIAEITNRTISAVFIPRNKLNQANKRDEIQNVGTYFLFGKNEEHSLQQVYIGESEDCLKRLRDHNRSKDFWTHAVVMVSKTSALTKTHVKYLEYLAVKRAQESSRFYTENDKVPAAPFVTESMEADLLDSFETIQVLLETLGFPLFDAIEEEPTLNKNILSLKGKAQGVEIEAKGDLVEDGFIVYKGSDAKLDTVPSCHYYLINLRNQLIKDNILINNGMHLSFNKNYVFSSPSTAGGVVLGRSTNGWTSWKSKDGKTLDEIKRN